MLAATPCFMDKWFREGFSMKSLFNHKQGTGACVLGALALAALCGQPSQAQTGIKPGNMSSAYQHAPTTAGRYQPSVTHGNSNEYHAPRPEAGYVPEHPKVQEYAHRTEKDLTARQINKGFVRRQEAIKKAAQARAKKFAPSGARKAQ